MTKPLMIGFEDSPAGRDALALGGQLATALGLKPLVVRVVTVPEGVLTSAELSAALRAALSPELSAALEPLSDLEPEGETVDGTSAARGLHQLAEEREAAAIIVGSSDRGAVGRVVPGSTASRLLAGAPCAVAVAARGHAETGEQPRRIAVAYDGSPEARAALETAATLASAWEAKVSLLCAVERINPTVLPAGATVLNAADLEERERGRAEKLLEEGLVSLVPEIAGERHLLHGSPVHVIPEASEDFDLLVLGSRGYGPLRRTLLGSASRGIVDRARCSVLAVTRGGVRPDPDAGVDDGDA